MNDLYKNALQNMRNAQITHFTGLSLDWSYSKFEKAREQSLPPMESSEKQDVLESFTQFSLNKLQETTVYNFKGGQLREALNAEHKGHLCKDREEFLARQTQLFGNEIVSRRFQGKNVNPNQSMKVCFVSDSFVGHLDTVEQAHLQELSCFFERDVAVLFNKMIAAMGLKEEDYFVTALARPMDEDELLVDNLIEEILYLKPQFIVSLGAKAVNELLHTNKRLKSIHGQFFELNFTDQNDTIFQASLMPLFSPKLLHIAPNMKQTAWKDMQKLMERLAKFVK